MGVFWESSFTTMNMMVEIKSTVNEELIKTHNAVRYHGQSKDDIAAEHLANRELLK